MDSIIIKADGSFESMPDPKGPVAALNPKGLLFNNEMFTLEQLQEAVNGYIAIIPICLQAFERGGPDLIALCDEEAMLKEAPVNAVATLLISSVAEPIYGDVVIMPSWRMN